TDRNALSGDGMAQILTAGFTSAMGMMGQVLGQIQAVNPRPVEGPRDPVNDVMRTAELLRTLRAPGSVEPVDQVADQLRQTIMTKALEAITTGGAASPNGPSTGQIIAGMVSTLMPVLSNGVTILGQYMQVRALEAQAKLRTPGPRTAIIPPSAYSTP